MFRRVLGRTSVCPLKLIHLKLEKGVMKTFSIAILILLSATLCFGQAPTAALYNSNSDVYVGYITTFPDYGPHWNSFRFNGVEVAYTRDLGPHWGVIASGAAVFGSVYDVKQFSGTAGAKFNFLTGHVRPYATGQVGYSWQSSNGMYAGDHHPPLAPNTTDTEDGFTYRAGAGVDVQMSRRIYWRIVQWDVQPQPWGRHTPFYNNFSSGIGFRL